MSLINGGIKNIMENKTRDDEEELKTMAKYLRQYCNDSECEHCIFMGLCGCQFGEAPFMWNLED